MVRLAQAQKKAAAPEGHRRQRLNRDRLLAEVVRNVVEGRVQLVADALHRSNSGNSDQGRNQAVLNRGRTLRIFDQLDELAHGRHSLVPGRGPSATPGSAAFLLKDPFADVSERG